MSKSNSHVSNSILNEEKDNLEGKGRDLGASTPCLTKDSILTVDDGNIGGENGIMSSPERTEAKREGMTVAISMRGARPPPQPNSRMWAVLIGIDGYKTNALSGCVSDARLMEDYLIHDARVEETRIQCLLGPSGGDADMSADSSRPPTRKNIIETLQSLVNNDKIAHGDDIIIYYAGHGASYRDPTGHTGNTETLCPIDRDTKTRCYDISDREINVILHQISRSKGNRITVILDCCYSGGATRGNSEGRFRSTLPLSGVSAESTLRTTDEDLNLSASHQSVLANGWRPIMDSHVILAACRETESARETSGDGSGGCNGVFTMALLHALKSKLLTRESTYMDLLNFLVVGGQKPVLAGKHKSSQLGDLKVVRDRRS